MTVELNKVYCCDVLDGMKSLADKSIDCCITSPPYWQLRNYGWDGQWGLEPTFQEYVEHLWQFMDELYRVLKDDGTAWINLGDTYGTVSGSIGSNKRYKSKHDDYIGEDFKFKQTRSIDKCLLLIPHRFGIGCIERGWIIRNDIVWAKPNAMPESVDDRFSKKHEYFFFMVKNRDYYFDLKSIKDTLKTTSIERMQYDHNGNPDGLDRKQSGRPVRKGIKFGGNKGGGNEAGIYSGNVYNPPEDGKKNPGDVADFWDISTRSSNSDHYAAYNTKLIDKPIIAGCPKNGTILDPFCGTATTILRSIELGRNAIGFDGSEKYVNAANKKLNYMLSQTKLF